MSNVTPIRPPKGEGVAYDILRYLVDNAVEIDRLVVLVDWGDEDNTEVMYSEQTASNICHAAAQLQLEAQRLMIDAASE
jgi:hypothetical protein